MSLIGTLVVSIVGDNKAFKSSLIDSKKQLSGFGATVQKHSAAFMKTGAVMMGFAGAIGIAAIKVGKEFDKAYSKIRTGTGKTGKVLEGLKKDFRAVVKDVPNSFDEVSTAIADLNTRLGLTGKPLQAMAKQMLNLARITETDVNAVIRTSTRLFGDWDVAVEDQAETLDYLYRVSQSTGVGIDRLSDMVTTYGVQLRTVGFTMEESLALMGKWEKEGVSAEKMLGGLSMALGRFAKAQKEPEEAMRRLMEQIEKAPTVGKAMELGVEALGTRAGPDFALAVREGRFAVEDFVAELAGSSETINQAAKDTMTLTEKFDLLKNRAKLAIEPLAKKLMDELSPALEKVTDWLGDLDDEQLENIASSVLWAAKIAAIGGAFLFAMGAVGKFIPIIKIATGWMTAFGVATKLAYGELLLIGAAVVQLSIQVYGYYDAITKAKEGTQSWAEFLYLLIPVFGSTIYFARKARDAIVGINEATEEQETIVDEATKAIMEYSSTFPEVVAQLSELNDQFGRGEISLEDYEKQVRETINDLEEYIRINKALSEGNIESEKVIGRLITRKGELAESLGIVEEATDGVTGATEDETSAFEDAEEAAAELRKEVDKLFDSLFELYNLNQSVTEATWDYEDAQAALKKITEDANSTDRDRQEALFKVQDEMEDVIDAIWREYSAEGTSLERKEELRKKYIEVKDEAVDRGFETEEAFKGIDEQFEIMAGDIYSNIYGPGGIIPSYGDMYSKGVELDEQKIEPEIKADTGKFFELSGRVERKMAALDRKVITITFKGRQIGSFPAYAKGGIAGFAGGGIAGSDGFSLPILTAAQGLITLPRADEGMLALLHPPELVLNPDQALRVLWKIANEPTGAKSSSIQNTFYISELIVREEADIHRIAEDLYDLQQTKQRGLGEK